MNLLKEGIREMKKYKGTKVIKARTMNRGEYNKFQGWKLPVDEDASDKGYLVGYSDPKGNFDGPLEGGCHHLSWSPKFVFEPAYSVENISLGSSTATYRQPSPIMRYFEYKHLPIHLQVVSKRISELATYMDNSLPVCPEKTAGLRKLLESKDCFVRANLGVK